MSGSPLARRTVAALLGLRTPPVRVRHLSPVRRTWAAVLGLRVETEAGRRAAPAASRRPARGRHPSHREGGVVVVGAFTSRTRRGWGVVSAVLGVLVTSVVVGLGIVMETGGERRQAPAPSAPTGAPFPPTAVASPASPPRAGVRWSGWVFLPPSAASEAEASGIDLDREPPEPRGASQGDDLWAADSASERVVFDAGGFAEGVNVPVRDLTPSMCRAVMLTGRREAPKAVIVEPGSVACFVTTEGRVAAFEVARSEGGRGLSLSVVVWSESPSTDSNS
ncbi:hypothetical protein [Streptomyces cinnamoneus]|uniref:hypothetical protein n=1 Tax=Streptomyces cinnamoneus TaxID=53446 RepID=UPI000CEDE6EA|nr:hypothetical protein [Streptomyces cinnamoneus]PPT16034.1 hypothetical protein CYQ11_27050 [Streptomyces cinnamoneus]